MTIILDGTTGITTPTTSTTGEFVTSVTGFKNRIINGAMVIDQRNAGASVTVVSGNFVYTLDRFSAYQLQASKFSVQRDTVAPSGFINSLKVTSLSAYSVLASDLFMITQTIEGLNIADLAWGTASAATVTLSFRVYSSLTGTFGGSILNSAANRSYPFTYSVPTANTWTTISVTIAGDTSGTWLTTNGIGMYVSFGLGMGSTYSGTAGAWAGAQYWSATGAVSVVGTNGATFYITGVQLEKGSTATSFDYRPQGTELQLCQRYYEKSYNQDIVPGVASFTPGFASSTASSAAPTQANGCSFKVTKRANPTCVSYNAVTGASGSAYRVSDGANVAVTLTSIGYSGVGYLDFASSSNGYYWHFTASAEL